MPNFSITRAEAEATITPKLAAIKLWKVLCGWEHESGAWLVICQVPAHPNVYALHWRATPIWQCGTIEFIDAYECQDDFLAWGRALSSAEHAWKKGPGDTVAKDAAGSVT